MSIGILNSRKRFEILSHIILEERNSRKDDILLIFIAHTTSFVEKVIFPVRVNLTLAIFETDQFLTLFQPEHHED